MVKRLPIFLLILSTPAAFAQLDSNSVTVSATRSLAQQPDNVLFGVTVQSGLNTSLDDVVAALQGSGITAANFSAVTVPFVGNLIPPQPPTVTPMLQWTFALPAPLAKIKDTIATLTGLQQQHRSPAANNAVGRADFVVQRSGNSSFRAIAAVAGLPDIGPACRRNRAGTKASWRRGAQSRSHTGDIQRNIRSRQCRFCSLNKLQGRLYLRRQFFRRFAL